jgi:pyruvate-formate lyase-activating enzyme
MITWDIKVEDSEDPGKCTKRPARNVKKNAKFLSSPGKTVRYIVKTVFQSVKIEAAKHKDSR